MIRPPPTPLLIWTLASAVLLLGSIDLGAWWPSPAPIAPEIRDGAILVVDRQALAGVDLALIHKEIVSDWVVAKGGIKELHWEHLHREAGRDPNLGALLDRMGVLIDADPVLNAEELLGLIQAWNTYLEKAGEPWRLSGEVALGAEGGTLRLKSYRVLSDDGEVQVGQISFPASGRRRVDNTTQVDAWLGHVHSHEEGVVLLLDRLSSFALDRVWPMLDPALGEVLDPLQQTFAPAVRAEVARALTPEQLDALVATAEDRMWLIRAAESVHARHRCGSQFLVSRVPWDGLSPRDLATLQLHAARGDDEPCPDVTQREALVFATRSHHLRRQPGVAGALERLISWVAQAVAIHEARHAADVASGARRGLSCLGCPDEITHVGVLEGSAYLASFAHPDSAALSLFQACGLDGSLVPERAAMVSFLAERLVPEGCSGSPDLELAQRARALELEIFRRSEEIRIVRFPDALPVTPERDAP